jgi:hypothetical protein
MGQQQLLLLVLSTVIVGLATVAGIQAFDEGQSQATLDALQQRALSVGADINGALQTPSQLGGVSLSSADNPDIAVAAGYDGVGNAGTGDVIPADGAGDSAGCQIGTTSSSSIGGGGNAATVTCQSNDSDSLSVVVEVTEENGPTLVKINEQNIAS